MCSFEIFHKMDWSSLVREYGVDGKRLLPWDGYPMPFSGAWCVVRPGTMSEPHVQIDQEVFIAMRGKAKLVVGERAYDFESGDTAVMPKRTNHYVVNESMEDFHFYVVWWDQPHAHAYLQRDLSHLDNLEADRG